jgi:AcrR family transcriptional regulator
MGPSPQLRGPKVIEAILNATLDEISEKGYSAVSFESIAQRAGVNKTTVYRRWRPSPS